MTGRSLRQLIWRWPIAIVQNQQAHVSRLPRCTVRAKFCHQTTPRWYCTPCRYHGGAGGIRKHAGIGCTPARQRSSTDNDSAGGQRSDRRNDQKRWGMGRWTLLNVAATGAASALLGEALRKPAQCRKLQGINDPETVTKVRAFRVHPRLVEMPDARTAAAAAHECRSVWMTRRPRRRAVSFSATYPRACRDRCPRW